MVSYFVRMANENVEVWRFRLASCKDLRASFTLKYRTRD